MTDGGEEEAPLRRKQGQGKTSSGSKTDQDENDNRKWKAIHIRTEVDDVEYVQRSSGASGIDVELCELEVVEELFD